MKTVWRCPQLACLLSSLDVISTFKDNSVVEINIKHYVGNDPFQFLEFGDTKQAINKYDDVAYKFTEHLRHHAK